MPTILVVDDDHGILEAVQALLEDEGYAVVVSPEPSAALELPASNDKLPDLILLDVLLSGQDGREVCRALKHEPYTRDIPIIMMSAHPNVDGSVRACGADGFLPKPYDIDDLLNVIESNLPKEVAD